MSESDLSTLTDTELNERIAVLCGYIVRLDCEWHGQCWHFTDGWHMPQPPSFVSDLNALKSGPEKMLRAQGWRLMVTEWSDNRTVARWAGPNNERVRAEAPTEERARAEAACQGLGRWPKEFER